MSELLRIRFASKRELAAINSNIRELGDQKERDEETRSRDISALEQEIAENHARREIVVRAPESGVVTAITVQVGQLISAGTGIAIIVPAGGKLEAEIYAPSKSAGFVKPGMVVLLRYQAYPYQKFGQYSARVREISITSLRPEEMAVPGVALPPGTAMEPLYRIRLDLDSQNVMAYGRPVPLKSGMLVDTSILLEHRRLYEWILEPIFSLSGRM